MSVENNTQKQVALRQYETLYILRPELSEEVASGIMRTMKDWVQKQGGTSIQVSCLGRKKLAWLRVNYRKGIFVKHTYVGPAGIVKEYEHTLAMDERVMLRQSLVQKHEIWRDFKSTKFWETSKFFKKLKLPFFFGREAIDSSLA